MLVLECRPSDNPSSSNAAVNTRSRNFTLVISAPCSCVDLAKCTAQFPRKSAEGARAMPDRRADPNILKTKRYCPERPSLAEGRARELWKQNPDISHEGHHHLL